MASFAKAAARQSPMKVPRKRLEEGLYPAGCPDGAATRTRMRSSASARVAFPQGFGDGTPPRRTPRSRSPSSSPAGAEQSAEALQLLSAAHKLLASGTGEPAAADIRAALLEQFGARAVSKARAQLVELVPGWRELVTAAPATPSPRRSASASRGRGAKAVSPNRRLGSVEPVEGAVDWNSVRQPPTRTAVRSHTAALPAADAA